MGSLPFYKNTFKHFFHHSPGCRPTDCKSLHPFSISLVFSCGKM